MKLEMEFTISEDGRPTIRIKHHDKDGSIEQMAFKGFLKIGLENGIEIAGTNGLLSDNESWMMYELKPKK